MTDYPIFERLRQLATPHHISGHLHTEIEIQEAEKRLDVRFPQDYRSFLLRYSDISLPFYDYEMADFHDQESSVISAFEFWQKEFGLDHLLPFATANSDFICFELMGRGVKKIRYWAHDYQSNETWDSFTDWVEQAWMKSWLDEINDDPTLKRRNRGDNFNPETLFNDIQGVITSPEPNFISAIITNAKNDVLMIYVQGETDPQPYWSLPGGRVEKGETALSALIREVQEETGIQLLSTGIIAYQTEMQFDNRTNYAVVYHIGINNWSGTPNPNDPEDEILEAAWIPLQEAIQHLGKIDYLPMSEPPIAYLNKTANAGKIWHYRFNGNGNKWLNNG